FQANPQACPTLSPFKPLPSQDLSHTPPGYPAVWETGSARARVGHTSPQVTHMITPFRHMPAPRLTCTLCNPGVADSQSHNECAPITRSITFPQVRPTIRLLSTMRKTL